MTSSMLKGIWDWASYLTISGILDSSTGGSLMSRLKVEWLGREKMTGSLVIL
jgi:hypothetical protein